MSERKQDLRTGILGAILANLLASGRRKYQPADFVPKWDTGEPARQSRDDMKRAAMKWAAVARTRATR